VWFYSEGSGENGAHSFRYTEKDGAPAEWLNAISAARNIGIKFTSANKVMVGINAPLGYKIKTQNYTGLPISYSFPKKPAWVITASDSAYGTATGVPGLDTLMVVATAGATAETLRVVIRKAVYFTIEAESGALVSPMQTGSSSAASGGKYITTPAGTGNTIFPKTEATYSYHAAAADSYYVWLRVLATSINPSANYGTLVGFNAWTSGKSAIINWTANQYIWIRSTSFNLSAGAHQLILGHGSEQVQIDKIVITNCTETLLPDILPPNANITGFNTVPRAVPPVLEMSSSGKTIDFQVYLNKRGSFSLNTYDVSGRKMWEYEQSNCAAGLKEISITKGSIENGVYFTRLTANTIHSVIKYSIMK
jgi:hypothetical protein